MTDDPYAALHAARSALDQEAMLEALQQNAGLRDPYIDWKRVHAYALELAQPALDPRAWSDAHVDPDDRMERAARHALDYSLTTWHAAHLLDDDLFMERGADVGPLASLTLFSTDFTAWDVGGPRVSSGYFGSAKAHAPGLCQHSDRLTAGGLDYGKPDEALTYGEFLPKLAANRGAIQDPWSGSRACSKCGGVTMRLLTAAQLAHLERVRDVAARADAATPATVTPIRRGTD